MPTIVDTRSIAAGATVTNVLAGKTYEFLRNLSRVDVGIVSDNAAGEVTADIQFGPEIQAEQVPVGVQSVAGAIPRIPEDIIVSDAAAAGDRLVIRVTNGAAGAQIVRTLVRIRPIA